LKWFQRKVYCVWSCSYTTDLNHLPQVGHFLSAGAEAAAGLGAEEEEEEAALPNLGRPKPTIEI
jgi:hypothetical protein